jgi:hypothetical protein
MRSGLRFRPPEVEFTPEVRWTLLRGFGPPERTFEYAIDSARVESVASLLDLAPRIGGRVALTALQAELGEVGGRAPLVANVLAGLVADEIVQCARLVAEVAASISVPIAFLKGVALQLCGVVAEGSRPLSDVDVLVPPRGARELAEALEKVGFGSTGSPSQEHHLPPLRRGSTELVELHDRLLGVRLSRRRRYATLGEMEERGIIARVTEMPGACFVPNRELLVAHALAHGLAQHGLPPGSYPLMRMLADLVDLGLAGPDGAKLLEGAYPWLAGDVRREEADATRALCVALTSHDEALFAPRSVRPDAILLRHVLAGAMDEGYRAATRLTGLWAAPSGHARPIAWCLAVLQALILTRGQIDRIYGRPRTAWGYLGWRLVRPFDLVRRLVRYTVRAVRFRQRF